MKYALAAWTLRDVPILLLDLADFSKVQCLPKKRLVLERLQAVLEDAARFFMPFGSPWERWRRHGTGDGYYFLFEALGPVVAARYALYIRDGLAKANRVLAGDACLRARLVLALGDVELVGDQLLSDQFVEAERLISDDRFKAYAAGLPQPAALACTEVFHARWREDAGRVTDARLAAARRIRWSATAVTDKHGHVWRGYVAAKGGAVPERPRPEQTAVDGRPGALRRETAVREW
jgi:hypothetical protein